ncbi:FMN-binding protein [Acetobacterium sp.]|uniref:FMN-binding protein n=1 Tax=Acetobacterium sp. TaxID=1872094 RepID=UPI00271D1FCC|nr:FMN-binding protein [Acetobacterium sp.]MDO9492452.1 FMN-binding protein [Acetobacterium sp.]
MTVIINVLTAWLSVIFVVLLTIIYLLRIVNKGKRKNIFIAKINRNLRNSHKTMGIAFVITACIHGFFSSGAILSFNYGTLSMVIGVLLGLTYMLRKLLPGKCTWIKPHRWLTVVLIVFLGIHLWEVGGIMGPEVFFNSSLKEVETSVAKLYGTQTAAATTVNDQSDPVTAENSSTAGAESKPATTTDSTVNDTVVAKANLFLGSVDLKDGTYTGVAEGYGPELTVSVTVAGNVITDVLVVSHNEKNVKYYGKAIDAVPAAIIAAQTPLVDTISGATYTSNGIMQAVINALAPAVISGTLPSL